MGMAAQPSSLIGDYSSLNWLPHVAMQFENEDVAYAFYNKYSETVGFSVRKSKMWTTSKDVVAARTFVCSRQGFRQKKKGFEPKNPRPATRTGCQACMTIKITPSGRYRVTDFVQEHNHPLAAPSTSHTMRFHRTKSKGRNAEIDMVSDLGIEEKPSNELRLKHTKAMQVGDAGAVLEYLQKMQVENPSFFYAIQVDRDDKMTNFFWADSKSVLDYKYFGDVVCFDTTYKLNDRGNPLALFVGVNHHRQMIIFGSALIYDESADTFRWLFETFNTLMHGKQPETILTDRCTNISDAVSAVWPGTSHRYCVWHVYQNATRYLTQVFEGSKSFAHDFACCIFDFEEEEEFLSAWKGMIEKYDLYENEWLMNLFEDREQWALPYGREVFCADMKSALRKEIFCSFLAKGLSTQQDLLVFFEHYNNIVDERRFSEIQADLHASQSCSKTPNLRVLRQAANAYTPAVFKMFQSEYEMYMDCLLYSCGEVGTILEYKVTAEENPKEHFVRFDSLDGAVSCSCKMYESVGIQCRHVFKVLDFKNIKDLPPEYILKRWRKDAKFGPIIHNHEYLSASHPSSFPEQRYNYLCCIFNTIAARAAKTVEAFKFIESQTDLLTEQVEQIFQARSLDMIQLTDTSSSQSQNFVGVADTLLHDNSTEANFVNNTPNGILGF